MKTKIKESEFDFGENKFQDKCFLKILGPDQFRDFPTITLFSLSNQPELIWGDESERIHPHHHYYPIPDTKFLRYYIYLFTAVCLFALLYVPTYNIIPVTYVCINLKSLDHTHKNSDYCLQFTIICKSNVRNNHIRSSIY